MAGPSAFELLTGPPFRRGLGDMGYVEGRNIVLE
jgi:hypothetical protein